MLSLLVLAACSRENLNLRTTRQNEPIASPPTSLSFGGFYKKCVYFRGLPIIGSEKVNDRAFRVIIETFTKILNRIPDEEFQILLKAGSHYSIIAATEGQTDLPEYADLRHDPNMDWNKRARGLGGLNTSGGEENILEYPNDRYKGESIYIHEFAHTLADYMFTQYDPQFDKDLQSAYDTAKIAGLWRNTYSATNKYEYWAEGVQMYFDCARTSPHANGVHNEISNRVGLEKYDPFLYALVNRAFRGNSWRYQGSYNTSKNAS